MIFHETPLVGARLIEPEKRGDDRGFFTRVFCEKEFAQAGLVNRFVQANDSLSVRRGTLRGMHYQLALSAEVKVVRCVRGALFNAIVDLRPDSPSYGRWFGIELNDQNRLMMYVPRGFANAFLTLAENTEILYFASEFYAPSCERGIRWNDPNFKIEWPIEPTDISEKDSNWPDFDPQFHGVEALRGLLQAE